MKLTMLEKLREHFANTSQEELQKEWNTLTATERSGPTVFDYLNCIVTYGKCNTEKIFSHNDFKFDENITPNFSGSFFCFNIAI